MDKIRLRDMQRWSANVLELATPVCVTHDSQAKFVLLTLNQYNQMVKKALYSHDSHTDATIKPEPERRNNGNDRHDSQATPTIIPVYNPSIHRAGDRVMVKQGRRMVESIVPELDADGNPIR